MLRNISGTGKSVGNVNLDSKSQVWLSEAGGGGNPNEALLGATDIDTLLGGGGGGPLGPLVCLVGGGGGGNSSAILVVLGRGGGGPGL